MSYYKATELIKNVALNQRIITTVTHGDLNDIDIKRQTIFPLLHVVPQTYDNQEKLISYSFTLLFCDIVDFNKNDLRNEQVPYWGTDNLIDIFHNMSLAAQLFSDEINRSDINDENILITIPNSGSFFNNRFENKLAGVELGLQITMPNTAITDGIC